MSVNIDVSFTVRELKDESERAGVAALLTEVLKTEGLDEEVSLTLGDDGGTLFVQANSDHPIIFSGFYRWSEEFEESLTSQVAALVPHAEVDFDWGYPDEE
ncbi:hypothetical protein ACFQ1S_16795 [Kibdelosporangium lantanae]|uniref:Uncharacterized protein n=1 Tax=Kibdelosporangium lantanae TaxID=1497396 RepID=A0ABW3M8R3_9PSEU